MSNCRFCRHWFAIEEHLDREDPLLVGQKVQLGNCRRYAPRPASLSSTASAEDKRVESFWPLVGSDDRCGELEPEVL